MRLPEHRDTADFRRVILLAFVAIASVVLTFAVIDMSSRRQAPAASGVGFQWVDPSVDTSVDPSVVPSVVAKPDKESFRIAYWNIASGKGGLDKIAAALGPVDVVGLSEVRGKEQLQTLASETNLGAIFAPTELRGSREDFGNAFLSSLNIESWQRIPLAPGPRQSHFRNVLLTRVQINHATTVSILTTHIDRTIDRQSQLRDVLSLFNSLTPPAVLMGDFNTNVDDEQLAKTLANFGTIDPHANQSIGKWSSVNRIDWMLVKGLIVVESGMHDEGESDHPMIWATLRPIEVLSKTAAPTAPVSPAGSAR